MAGDWLVRTTRTIPAAVRRAVIQRDGMVCRRCGQIVRRQVGRRVEPDTMHLDHVNPWAAGGESTVENLIVCCAACNLSREKPRHTVRSAKVRVEWFSGRPWWRDPDFVPPSVPSGDRRLYSVRFAAEQLSCSPLEILQMVVNGHLSGTGAGDAIRVEMPEWWYS